MKNNRISISVLALSVLFGSLWSCSQNELKEEGFTIKANIVGLKGGQAKLAKLDLVSNETVYVDSTPIINGRFSFKGKLEGPYMHAIKFSEMPGSIDFFLENSKIELGGDVKDLSMVKITGSREDSLFHSFSIDAIFDRQEGMNIMLDNPDYTFAAFVAYYQFQIHNIHLDTMELICNSFNDEVKETVYFEHLSALFETIKRVAISQPAPGFCIPDNNGNLTTLSDFKGKYVLIDFWASWCAPCRASNPGLVKVYNAFQDKGFTIIGISVDKNRDRWLQAIEKDGLPWTNLSNLNGWGEVSNAYAVKAVPQNFLIDPNGIIIDKNVETDHLTELLRILLN